MELQELLAFIRKLDAMFKEQNPDRPIKERAYARTIKLNEEVGELCDEVLSHFQDQRAEKLDGKSKHTMNDEFADVIITTLNLATVFDVDIEEALEKKIAILKTRFQLDEEQTKS